MSAFSSMLARGTYIAAEGENDRTGMETTERIEELKLEAEEQERLIESEKESIGNIQKRCVIMTALLCTGSMELVEVITQQVLEQMIKSQKNRLNEIEREKLDTAVRRFLEDQSKRFECLETDGELWPHILCKPRMKLDEKLCKARFELKKIENKMLGGTRVQLRKRALQMEEAKTLCSRMEQAVLSIESWEKLFLMFLDDREVRRQSGMDETFYLREREDIHRKLCICYEFSEVTRKELEEKLCLAVQNALNQFGILLAEHGFHFPKSIWTRSRTKISYTGTINLTEEMCAELSGYSVGIMFIEKHVHNMNLAYEKLEKAQKELERLKSESDGAGRLVV